MDTAIANTVLNTVNGLLLKYNAKGLLHVSGGTGKANGAPRDRSGIGFDLQVEFASEGAD